MARRILIIVLLLFITACSTKMSYRFIDWAVEWQLDDYVTLNASQQQAFDKVLAEFLIWHQREELDRYISQLDSLKQQMQSGSLTPALWAGHMASAREDWYRLFAHVFDGVMPIMQSLTDKQVRQLITTLKQNEADIQAEYQGKSAEELQRDSDKKLISQAEKWLGKLSPAQKAMIQKNNSERLQTLDMWLEYRHEWLRLFEEALWQRQDTQLFKTRMQLLMTEPQKLRSSAYQQAVTQNTERFGTLVIEMYRSLSDKQQRKLWRKYDGILDDLNELSREAKQPGFAKKRPQQPSNPTTSATTSVSAPDGKSANSITSDAAANSTAGEATMPAAE